MAKAGPKKKEGKPPPKCKAILLCERTIIEAVTGKISLIGVFDRFLVPQFPWYLGQFEAFLQMTDGAGKYAMRVEIRDLNNDTVLAKSDIEEVDFPNRMVKVHLMIPVGPEVVLLPHDGIYDLVVLADDQEIDRQQFTAEVLFGGGKNVSDAIHEPEGD